MERSITFIVEGDVDTQITVTEITELVDGEFVTSLRFDIVVLETGQIGDLRAIFFDLQDYVATDSLSVTSVPEYSGHVTGADFAEGGVDKLGKGANLKGKAAKSKGKFDVGVEFGTPGIGKDDIQETSFILSSSEGSLSLDMLDLADFGLRYTSVGPDVDGPRDDGLKITGEAAGVAGNDAINVDENAIGMMDLLANDTGGSTNVVTAAVDSDGAFVATSGGFERQVIVDGLDIGTLTVTADGTATFDANGADVDTLGPGDMVSYTFKYTTTAPNGALANALAVVTVTGTNDGPVAVNDAATITEDGADIVIDLLANDFDIDGGTLSIAGFDFTGLQGTVSDNGDGTITYSTDGAFDGLNDGESAIDSFHYTISDGQGGTATGEVNVTVTGETDVAANPVGVVGTYTIGAWENLNPGGTPQPLWVPGQGRLSQSNEVEAAGHVVQRVFDLSADELAGLDVLYVNNPSNGAFGVIPQDPYDAEFVDNLGTIWDAVAGGMTLILHDRHVHDAQLILPGGASFQTVRSGIEFDDINLLPGAIGTIDHGPGGTLTDATLDGGAGSNQGFAIAASLPADADILLSRANGNQVVTFGYDFGEGYVIYSSIPLDFYTIDGRSTDSGNGAGPLTQAEAELYAANLIDYGVDVAFDLFA